MREPTTGTHLFDAAAHAAALEAPELLVPVGDRVLRYEGRLLSIEEWLGFAERFERAKGVQASVAVMRDYFTAVFPRRRFRVWAPDPVAHLMKLPFATVKAAFDHFFALQARASSLALEPNPESSTTSGKPSGASTTRAPHDDALPGAA